jgi:hypothetical protein
LSGFSAAKTGGFLKNAKAGELKQLYTRVQNQTIPINVLRCDLNKRSHNEYLFTIFHRLNSGGMKLNNQEIRNCIYSGSLNEALKEMDQNTHWRAINNMQPDENYRFVKQEAILRFFAFLEKRNEYRGSVSKFLNDYMFARPVNERFPERLRNQVQGNVFLGCQMLAHLGATVLLLGSRIPST